MVLPNFSNLSEGYAPVTHQPVPDKIQVESVGESSLSINNSIPKVLVSDEGSSNSNSSLNFSNDVPYEPLVENSESSSDEMQTSGPEDCYPSSSELEEENIMNNIEETCHFLSSPALDSFGRADEPGFNQESDCVYEQIEEVGHCNTFLDTREWLDTGVNFMGPSLTTIPENQVLSIISEEPAIEGQVTDLSITDQVVIVQNEEQDEQTILREGPNNVSKAYFSINENVKDDFFLNNNPNFGSDNLDLAVSEVCDDAPETNSRYPEASQFPAINHKSTLGKGFLYPKYRRSMSISSQGENQKLKSGATNLQCFKEGDEEMNQEVLKHKDVDGGWAWVVLAAAFCTLAITTGTLFSFNSYFVPLMNEFGISKSQAAMVGALANGFYMGGSLLSNKIIGKFGCRIAMLLGTALMILGFLMSYFAPNFYFICFSIGIVTATGMSMCYLATLLILAQYFSERHNIAISLAMTGAGVGIFTMNAVISAVISSAGFSVALLVSAAIALLLIPCGLIYRALPVEALIPAEDVIDCNENSEPSKTSSCKTANCHGLYQPHLANKSFSSFMLAPQGSYLGHSLLSINSASSAHLGSRASQLNATSTLRNRSNLCHGETSRAPSYLRCSQMSVNSKMSSDQIGIRSPSKSSLKDSKLDLLLNGLHSNPHSFSRRHHGEEEFTSLISSSKLDRLLEEKSSRSGSEEEDDKSTANISIAKDEPTGYNSLKKASLEIKIGDSDDEDDDQSIASEDEYVTPKRNFMETIKRYVKDYDVCPVLKERCLWTFTIANFFVLLGTSTLYIIFEDFCAERQMIAYCALAQKLAGVGDMLGRLSAGLLADRKIGNSVLLHGMAILLSALLLMSYMVVDTGSLFVAVSFFYGIVFGAENTYVAINANALFSDQLAVVMTVNTFVPGIGYFFGSPTAGKIAESSGSYSIVILILISCCLFSSVLIFVTYLLHKRDSASVDLLDIQKHSSNQLVSNKNQIHLDDEPQIYKNIKLSSSSPMKGHNLCTVKQSSYRMNLERFVLTRNIKAEGLKSVQTEDTRLDFLPKRNRDDSFCRSETYNKCWLLPRNSTYDSFHSNRQAVESSLATFSLNSSPKLLSHGDGIN